MEGDHTYPVVVDEAITSQVRTQAITSVIIWAPKTTGVAHWRTSFTFGDPPSPGLSVDMFQPDRHEFCSSGETNRFGTLVLKPVTKLSSTNTFVKEQIAFTAGIVVQDLLDAIFVRKLQYYKFHEDGSGCMFWQLCLLECIQSKGWIGGSEKDRVLSVIKAARESSAGIANSMPWPPRQGVFYGAE